MNQILTAKPHADPSDGATLERWLTGPRFEGLPPRSTALPAPALSFEFFPPKNEALEAQLWTCIRRLEPLAPRFVSVTYGAGGSTQARTHATVARIVRETSLLPAAHLTCVGASRGEVDDVARQYWDAGVRHIVALRGDAPAGEEYVPHPQGYAYAADLVAGLKRVADFEISVAAYPETHPPRSAPITTWTISSASSTRAPRGRSRSISSRDRCSCASWIVRWRLGSRRPSSRGSCRCRITPRRPSSAPCAARRCRPGWGRCSRAPKATPETRRMIAAIVAAEQVRLLQVNGVDEFHFYTLNRPDLTYAIAHLLGVRPVNAASARCSAAGVLATGARSSS